MNTNTIKKLDLVALLEHSLSLSVKEKIQVIDSLPELNGEKLDELTRVFVDEKNKFEDVKPSDMHVIEKMKQKAANEWKVVCETYASINHA